MKTVVLPAMLPAQKASWWGLFDLAERMPDGWTLVGGQMVQLHCVSRPTLVGALIGKASALLLHGDVSRHLEDFVTLAVLVRPEDFTHGVALNQVDVDRVLNAIGRLRRDHPTITALVDGGQVALDRLAAHLARRNHPTDRPTRRSVPVWAAPGPATSDPPT